MPISCVPTGTNVDTLLIPTMGLPLGKLTLAIATRKGEEALHKWIEKVRQNVESVHISAQDSYIEKSPVPMNCLGGRLQNVLLQEKRPPLLISCFPADPDRYGHVWLPDVLLMLSSTPGHASRPYPEVAWLVYVTEDVLKASPACKSFKFSSHLTMLFDANPFDINELRNDEGHTSLPSEPTCPAYVRIQKNMMGSTQGHVITLDF